MILDDIACEYGVDTSIAFKFASNDSKEMLLNLRYFIDRYSDSNYVLAVLFGDNIENVLNFLLQLKKDCKLAGAYTLHMLCCELRKSQCITVEKAKEVRNQLRRVTEFWRLYIPGSCSGAASKCDELLIDLLTSVNFNMPKNIEYILKRLKELAVDADTKTFYKSLENDYIGKNNKSMIKKIIERANNDRILN